HNAIERKLFCHERLPSSWWQPTGVSDGAGTLIQPRSISATGQARWPVWGGSGRRTRTDTRLVPQPPAPHLGRLSLSGRHPPPHNSVECEKRERVRQELWAVKMHALGNKWRCRGNTGAVPRKELYIPSISMLAVQCAGGGSVAQGDGA